MTDFDQAREQTFEELSKIFSIEKTTVTRKAKEGYPQKIDQWKVVLEVPFSDRVRDFSVFLELKKDFPLSLPRIYLSEQDYEEIKYIPHVDDKRNICLFDDENIKLNTERPTDIVKACSKRAGAIIADGINKVNTGDFKDEVVAYWSNLYGSKDQVFEAYMGEGIETLAPGIYQGYLFSPAYHNVDFFMDSGTLESQKVIDFFRFRGHKLTEKSFFYLGEIDEMKPPFSYDNRGVIDLLKKKFETEWIQIRTYLNQAYDSKIFSFSLNIDGELLFFGFYLGAINPKINGWREKSLSVLNVLEKVYPTKSAARILFKYFSQSRLHKRTDGLTVSKSPYRFLLAGLGSIGSNLLHYLNSLEVSDFVLCDPDILGLENVNRHLLSFHDVGVSKVDAVSKYLIYHNPFLNLTKHQGSIVDLISKHQSMVNTMDVIFCAIGKDAIENYILQCLNDGKIVKPVMFFWVEPYLLGGHALYINPSTGFSLKDLEDDGFYRYNIISSETYKDPQCQTQLREAGCQGSYVPYGKAAISLFFANLAPNLYSIIANPPKDNLVFSFAGDLSIAAAQGFELSDFGKQNVSNQLTINTL
ncbi:ThiF family adenylyltransferase [Olivibacter sp. XZL3]|uniref:ThiF family adenylyltransferase n=1 Tax=Olivibacter sp. XZL3 TaxID=1735116 RepID=UPI001065B087|nr:ThiF family adenylyltransferase [Olivibacter sp. XZL3]